MPVQVSGTYADVTMLNRAFNDQSPSHNVYVNQVAAVEPIGITAFAQRFGAGFTGLTEDALSTKLLMNLGVLPNAGLQTALRDYLVSVGKANVGIVALQLGQILSGLENATGDLSVYAAAAVQWNSEVTASHAYSINPNNTGIPTYGWGPGVGVTLLLTAGDDAVSPSAAQAKFKTTANQDTILATTAGLLSTADAIDGAGGVDTLRATLAANATVAPTLQSVEKVFIQAGAHSTFMASSATGLTELWRESAAGPAEFRGVDLATTVGIRDSGSGGALTVVFAGTSGGADTANLVLFRAAGNDEVVVDSVEHLNVRSQGFSSTDGAANTARITANAAEKIVLTGEQTLKTTVVGAQVSVIDASALTGALSLAFATTQSAVTITGGGGADTFVINDASGAQVIVATGEGDDTITIGAGNAHSITLGGGADTLNLTGLAGAAAKDLDISFSAGLGGSAIVLTDFVSGTDRLVLAATTATAKAVPTGLQLAGISDASSLLDATALAATTAGANKAIAFRYGADTYILVNDSVAALGVNDSLVKLSGVSALADASWIVA
ncbi:hypothetical protein PMI14_04743 [Acidovorax sp. CF316]|uniref:bluetail domain-containing putative surface protein n=1 Tax=Acidovorax sp. CF316 TaxID=1144317 RepID=UPI00026BDBC8|nr:bluetail domain-containing putative surface protein [Acidovorax sp. CF316]EJE50566.1 hypothetical protein PMI14_04743 [Acidovorax sp. CF316]